MNKLFAEHFSVEEMKRIASIHQDCIYIAQLSEYAEDSDPE